LRFLNRVPQRAWSGLRLSVGTAAPPDTVRMFPASDFKPGLEVSSTVTGTMRPHLCEASECPTKHRCIPARLDAGTSPISDDPAFCTQPVHEMRASSPCTMSASSPSWTSTTRAGAKLDLNSTTRRQRLRRGTNRYVRYLNLSRRGGALPSQSR